MIKQVLRSDRGGNESRRNFRDRVLYLHILDGWRESPGHCIDDSVVKSVTNDYNALTRTCVSLLVDSGVGYVVRLDSGSV